MGKRLIDANELQAIFEGLIYKDAHSTGSSAYALCAALTEDAPTVDAVEVVRCQNCVHAQPFDRNCELSTTMYMHCGLQRGEETKNVWHKYKKYYKDYSVVDRGGFCDQGERIEE